MFGPFRTGIGLVAALIALAGTIAPAAAQGKPPQPTVTVIHQTHDNNGRPTGFSAANPDPTHVHYLITNPNGQKTIVTVPLAPIPTGYVQGANGQTYPTFAPIVHGNVKTSNPSINEERHTKTVTYSGTGKSKFHAVYSTQ